MYTAFFETSYPSRKLPSYFGEEDKPEYHLSACVIWQATLGQLYTISDAIRASARMADY
jgi:hypothetical protein